MKNRIIINALMVCLMLAIVACNTALAVPTINYVKINDIEYVNGDNIVAEKGETLDIILKVTASQAEDDVEIEADILGYEYNDHDDEEISDSTHTFDLQAGRTDSKKLTLKIPTKLEKDQYDLRVRVGGRTGTAIEYLYRLTIEGVRHSLNIRDVVLVPESSIKAGRTLLASARIQNLGEKDEEDIRVKMSIPELGVHATAYIDELEEDDSTESEQLYMRIPSCAKAGNYQLITAVEYDEGYEEIEEKTSIEIVPDEDDDTCAAPAGVNVNVGTTTSTTTTSSTQTGTTTTSTTSTQTAPKTIISVGMLTQEIQKGEGGVIYPVTISNMGKDSQSYTVLAAGTESWATSKISPTNMAVLDSGEAMTFYVYVAANEDAAPGEHVFTLSVKNGETTLKDISLSANVIEVAGQEQDGKESSQTGWNKLKSGFQISLVVLVVLLVILALIIGVNKLRKDDDEDEEDSDEEEEGQTYY